MVLGGLPGSGKTTLARLLARRLRAAHVRIDAIETALVASGLATDQRQVGPAGYLAAERVARGCLEVGTHTVVDAVHAVTDARSGWPAVADESGATLVTVLVRCGDAAEHRRRVEERTPDLQGHLLPDWRSVTGTTFDPWPDVRLVVDTSRGCGSAVDAVLAAVAAAVAHVAADADADADVDGDADAVPASTEPVPR